MTWQACVRDCSDFYPAADVSHGRGHVRIHLRTISCVGDLIIEKNRMRASQPGVEAIGGRGSEVERFWI